MLLIVILILSQDQGFSQSIQGVTLASVPWYKDRALQKTSLGKQGCCSCKIGFMLRAKPPAGVTLQLECLSGFLSRSL